MAKAYLEISLKINETDRANAGGVYAKYKAPFLETIKGATSKELLIRDEDVQVLHGFETAEDAQNYLSSELFYNDARCEKRGTETVYSAPSRRRISERKRDYKPKNRRSSHCSRFARKLIFTNVRSRISV